ncbi:MAG: GC-type dockerin domain-anchored protein [Planctomycetota bacterium]|nr:GC-type dockerin domain-anchored protein [Planctomycetota bacterium]
MCLAVLGGVSEVRAQLTLNFEIDDNEATAALGPDRLPAMRAAVERVKSFFERILVDSAANITVPLRWQEPAAGALADALGPLATSGGTSPRLFPWATVRNRLNTISEGGQEDNQELLMYESLPAQTVPFVWEGTSTQQATQVLLTQAQAQQLQLNPGPRVGDENRVRFRPPQYNQPNNPSALKWQFYPGPLLPGHQRFDMVAAHEVMHVLGYISVGDGSANPTDFITILDSLRFAEFDYPLNAVRVQTFRRELRPEVSGEAAVATRVDATLTRDAFKMSRGTRAGGDGYSTAHFRNFARLTPPEPIGIMDATGDSSPPARLAAASRADLQVLDMLGWVLDHEAVRLDIAGNVIPPTPVQPAVWARLRSGRPTFVWADTTTDSLSYALIVYRGDPAVLQSPLPVLFAMEIPAFSYQVPAESALAPGEYFWSLGGMTHELGGYWNEHRPFIVLCPADFNSDLVVDLFDYLDFSAAFAAEGASADFDENGQVDLFDFLAFIDAYSQPCEL